MAKLAIVLGILGLMVMLRYQSEAAIPKPTGKALDDVKAHGARNIWINADDSASIKKLAENGLNAVTAHVTPLVDAKSSATPDDPFLLRESDIPAARLELVRAQARECARYGLLYMPYINQLSDWESKLLDGRQYRRFVNSLGVEGGLAPCPLERKDWLGFQLPQILAFARVLAEEHCEGGVMLEGETYCAGDIYPGYHTQRQSICYCDFCWSRFREKLPESKKPKNDLKPAERCPWLSAQGMLWRYEQSEREELAKLLVELAAEVRKVKPDCVFGLYPCSVTWYNDAIVQGLGTKELPFLIYSATEYYRGFQTRRGDAWGWDNGFCSADQIRHFKNFGAHFLYQGGLSVGTYWPQRLGLEMARMVEDGDGFWIYWGGTLLAPDDKIEVRTEGLTEYNLREKPSLYWPQLKRSNEVMAKWSRGEVRKPKTGKSQIVWKDLVFTGPEGRATTWDIDHLPPTQTPLKIDPTRQAIVFDLGAPSSEPKTQNVDHTFRQIGKQHYLYGANLRYEGPSDGARIGLGWSFPGHVECDGRQIFRYINEVVFPEDGWTWLVRPLEVTDHDQPGYTEFQVQANPGRVLLRSLFLAPCSFTTLESPTLQLPEGKSWGNIRWKLENAERCYYTVDVFDAATGRQLYADVPNGFDLSDISRLYGLSSIKLKLTVHVPAGEKARLRSLTVEKVAIYSEEAVGK